MQHSGMSERIFGGRAHALGSVGLAAALLAPAACYTGLDDEGLAYEGEEDDDEAEGELDVEPLGPQSNVLCGPTMSLFPVAAPHNIGYDHASCSGPTGCEVSCPDRNANSDWSPAATHNGIDIFAHEGAPLVAVADGEVVAVGVASDTSGIRVKIRDACGWSYYYGHLQSAAVREREHVRAGDIIGYMGHTGAASTHLHFNVSPGSYKEDINPIDLLVATSPTACGAPPEPGPSEPAPDPVPEPEPEPPAPPSGTCGVMVAGDALGVDEVLASCDGRFSLVAQRDGNLVLYQNGGAALWHTQTHGNTMGGAFMQEDGNFVVYDANGVALWHTSTHGRPGTYLHLRDDAALILFDGAEPVWWSGTGGL